MANTGDAPAEPADPAARWAPSPAVTMGLVCVVCLLQFLPALRGGFVWDDLILIADNTHLRGPGAAARALTASFWDSSVPLADGGSFYRPMVKLTHALLVDAGPFGFHCLNLILHVVASLLVTRWLTQRVAAVGPLSVRASWAVLVAALVFALHSSRYESVGWVSGSCELLFGVFALLSTVLFRHEPRRWWALLPLALAVLSKETAIVLPVLFFCEAAACGELVARARPLLAALGTALVALAARVPFGIPFPNMPGSSPLAARLSTAAGTFAAYHQRTVAAVPTALPFDFAASGPGTFDVPTELVVAGAGLAAAWLSALLAAVRWPRLRPWLVDACWWLIPLLPVMNLVASPNKLMVADRYLYLSIAGVAAIVARAIITARTSASALALGGAAVAATLVCATQLGPALFAFENNQTFFAREVVLHPRSPTAREYYASALQGRPVAQQLVLETALLTLEIPPAQRTRMMVQLALALSGTGLSKSVACGLHDFFTHLGDSPVPLVTGSVVVPAPARASARLAFSALGLSVPLGQSLAGLECGSPDAVAWVLSKRAQAPRQYTWLALRFLSRAGRWDEALTLARADPALSGPALVAALTPAPWESEHERLLRIARVDALLGAPRAAPPLLEQALATTWDAELARALVAGLLAEGKVERARALVQRLGPEDPLHEAVLAAAADHQQQVALANPGTDDG